MKTGCTILYPNMGRVNSAVSSMVYMWLLILSWAQLVCQYSCKNPKLIVTNLWYCGTSEQLLLVISYSSKYNSSLSHFMPLCKTLLCLFSKQLQFFFFFFPFVSWWRKSMVCIIERSLRENNGDFEGGRLEKSTNGPVLCNQATQHFEEGCLEHICSHEVLRDVQPVLDCNMPNRIMRKVCFY